MAFHAISGNPRKRWRLTLRGSPVFRWNTRAPPASWRLTLRVNSWKNRLCTVHSGAHFAAFAANPPFFSRVLDAKNLLRIDFAKYFASCGARRGLCPSTPAARRQSPALNGSRALREKRRAKTFSYALHRGNHALVLGLGGIQMIIQPLLGQQLFMTAGFQHLLIADIQNPVTVFDGGQPVGDDKGGSPFQQGGNPLLRSVLVSMEEVASSRIRILGSDSRVRAKAISCFCP